MIETSRKERSMEQAPRKGRRWLEVSGCLVLAVVVALAFWSSDEPTYDRHTVTEWIRDFQEARLAGRNGANDYRENEAVRELGQKAVPFIVKELKVEDSGLKRAIRRLLEKRPFISVPLAPQQRRLGAGDALRAVGRVDPNFAKELIPLLDSADMSIQFSVARVLGESQIKEALPALIAMAASESERERAVAATGLGTYRGERNVVVPVLVKLLSAPEYSVITACCRALNIQRCSPRGLFRHHFVVSRKIPLNRETQFSARLQAAFLRAVWYVSCGFVSFGQIGVS